MGKVLYGFLFCVALPLALAALAMRLDSAVTLATPRWPLIGWSLALGGAGLMLAAMSNLWVRGGGLPMNAYPPPKLVTSGAFALVPHPIYTGFSTAVAGVSLGAGSPGGLWVVCPLVIAGCIALVMGYEGPALRRRFGGLAPAPCVRGPDGGEGPPSIRDRLALYGLLFLPWLVLYEGWGHAQPVGPMSPALPGEWDWPVWEWTTYPYSAAYPFVLAVPFVLRSRGDLRRFFADGWVTLGVMMLAYAALPFRTPPRPFDPSQLGGWLLAIERADGLDGAVALPAYHAAWAVLAASAWASRGRGAAAAGWIVTGLIAVSCATTGMHTVSDVVAGAAVAGMVLSRGSLWRLALAGCERLANAWACVRIGPVRILNYAGFSALAAGIGMFIAACLTGTEGDWRLLVIAAATLLGAALWGQVLVGSKTVLRPFGYFGAVLGAGASLGWIAAAHGSGAFWTIGGALAAASPWIVLLGRLRCLVQGCCHGRPIEPPACGIRYAHPASRAARAPGLAGVPVHPTPLYSMVCNGVIGLLMARLWSCETPLPVLSGLYLVLAGLTRFVEESYRGEPRTQIVRGLRIYQWCAVVSVVAGAVVMGIPGPAASGAFAVGPETYLLAVVAALLFAFGMGVDFPNSARRFSRLC